MRCPWISVKSRNSERLLGWRNLRRITARSLFAQWRIHQSTIGWYQLFYLVFTPCTFKIYNSDLCIALFSVLFKAVHRWLPLKPPAWSRGEEGIHSTPTIQYWKSCWRGRKLGGQLSIATGLKLQGHSTSLKAQYLPSASTVSQMRFICLFTVYDATFPKVFDVACETWCCCVMA